MKIAQDEIFGPILSVITFESEEETVQIANSVEYGLAASVWTNNINRAYRISRALDSGIVWINTNMADSPAAPAEGFKQSGFGKKGGMESLKEFMTLKTVWIGLAWEKHSWIKDCLFEIHTKDFRSDFSKTQRPLRYPIQEHIR